MGIILGELTNPGQAMEYAGFLMSMHQPHLKISNGQVPVGAHLRLINKHVCQAVHGFNPIGLALNLGEVHVFPVVFKMARTLPHFGLEQLWTYDHLITAAKVCFFFKGL